MPQVPRLVGVGDEILFSDHNDLVENIAALWKAVERQDWLTAVKLASQLAYRVRFVRIKRVHSGGVTTTDPAATPPPDYPQNVTYDVVIWGDGEELANLTPKYNRAATGGDVQIRPAKVDDWARLLRGKDSGEEEKGELEILTEELDRAECEAPSPEQARQSLLTIARAALDLGIAEGMLGTPVLLTDAVQMPGVNDLPENPEASVQTVADIPAVLFEGVLDLNQTTAIVRVPLPAGLSGVTVYIDKEAGTWARDVKIRHAAPSTQIPTRDFASPLTLTAAGTHVQQISAADLAGVRELVFEGSGVTAEAASVRIVVTGS